MRQGLIQSGAGFVIAFAEAVQQVAVLAGDDLDGDPSVEFDAER